MSNAPNHHYRSALALNNMAVVLLQNTCYEPALKMVSDSLVLMQMAFAPTAITKRRKMVSKSIGVFDKASKRYCHALKSTSGALFSKASIAEVEPVDDNDISALRAAVNYGPSSSVVFPVRISDFSSCENNNMDVQEITKQLGIILYNQAIVKSLLSSHRSSHKGTKKEYTTDSTRKSLEMAQKSFCAALNQDDDHRADGGGSGAVASSDCSLLLVLALTLNALNVCFHSKNMATRAFAMQRIISSLCSDVDKKEFLANSVSGFTKCSPAA